MSPDFLLSEDVVAGDKVAAAAGGAPTNQAPPNLISPPLPPSAEAAKTGAENAKENKTTTIDAANN